MWLDSLRLNWAYIIHGVYSQHQLPVNNNFVRHTKYCVWNWKKRSLLSVKFTVKIQMISLVSTDQDIFLVLLWKKPEYAVKTYISSRWLHTVSCSLPGIWSWVAFVRCQCTDHWVEQEFDVWNYCLLPGSILVKRTARVPSPSMCHSTRQSDVTVAQVGRFVRTMLQDLSLPEWCPQPRTISSTWLREMSVIGWWKQTRNLKDAGRRIAATLAI